jgi:hypothetical protein
MLGIENRVIVNTCGSRSLCGGEVFPFDDLAVLKGTYARVIYIGTLDVTSRQ